MTQDNPLSVADVLDRAADLLTPEGAWTQGAFCIDTDGIIKGYPSSAGVCWCANGAIWRASGMSHTVNDPAQRFLARAIGEPSVYGWNDAPGRTQAEVVAKLREAAALARAGQPS